MIKKIIFSVALLAASGAGVATRANSIGATVSAAAAPAPGEAADFTLNDINGKPFKLSSLQGKYVIIDFWGSWCINCIKGFPKMKEYYAQHKDRLEIVSVDCNDNDARWKAAVKKHALPWINVYNPKGDGNITKKLAVTAFPTKILVGPDGKIVKTFVGETDDIYTELDTLLKEK